MPKHSLPSKPDMGQFRSQARALLAAETELTIEGARRTVARDYGFDNWDSLRLHVEPAVGYTTVREAEKVSLAPDHEFFRAVGKLDLDRVRVLLEQDPSLVDADVRGNASLAGNWGWGSRWGDPNPEDTCRAVHFAYGHADLLRLLIEYDADLDALGWEGNYGWSPALVLACWEGTVEVTRILLEGGANPNVPSFPRCSALYSAINHWSAENIELLLEHGAMHDLFSAAIVGDLDEVKRQLRYSSGSWLNRRDISRNKTALEWAASRQQEEVAEYLIEIGAEVIPQVSAGLGMLEHVKELIEKNSDAVNQIEEGRDGDTPLIAASRHGHVDVVRYLLEQGADVNLCGGNWEIQAIDVARTAKVVELLAQAGADVCHVLLGRTPLMAQLGGPDERDETAVQALVKYGGVGWFYLVGRWNGHLERIEPLLELGADVNEADEDGKTALDHATARDDTQMIALLEKRGGRRGGV